MRPPLFIGICLAVVAFGLTSCHDGDKTEIPADAAKGIKEENITYTGDGVTMNGYVVYDSTKTGKLPIVLVVHEWWGLTEYPRMRAKQLADLGYIAMAIDMFGNGKTADNPDSAMKLAGPFYNNAAMAKARFDAAVAKIMTYSQADTSKIAAIGYCFGGGMALNVARLGENLDGVVSFHGGLIGTPANKDLLKANILVCHGEADPMVPQAQVDQFKKQMDSIGAKYTFKSYPGATHAFTNPAATETGKKFNIPVAYNGAADTASWNDMKAFLGDVLK
ncbi:MAG: dienelactone hydrolase family protein [Chitinophagaceae bacterium]|nr:dienelactone hydrolase family protein [Chitinophagaceae bacterium]